MKNKLFRAIAIVLALIAFLAFAIASDDTTTSSSSNTGTTGSQSGTVITGSADSSNNSDSGECKFYIDVTSDENLFFSRYDIAIYVDSELIGTVSNGEEFYKLITLSSGTHKLKFTKSGSSSPSGTYDLNITGNMSLTGKLSHDSSSVTLKDQETSDNVDKAEISVPELTGMLLADASSQLAETGFVKYYRDVDDAHKKDDTSTLFVTAQDFPVGSIHDWHDIVTLTCVPINTYLEEKLIGKTFNEAIKIAIEDSYFNYYAQTENGDDCSTIESSAYNYWEVNKAEQDTTRSNTSVLLTLQYLGTPEERAQWEAERLAAEEESRRVEESKAEESRQVEEKRKMLESVFSVSDAKKVLVVGFMNNFALDVYTSDGNSYDISKFHNYYYCKSRVKIYKDGIWTPKTDNSWHVDDIRLIYNASQKIVKISCDIELENNTYKIIADNYYYDKLSNINNSPAEIDITNKDFNKWLTLSADLLSDSSKGADNVELAKMIALPCSDYFNVIGKGYTYNIDPALGRVRTNSDLELMELLAANTTQAYKVMYSETTHEIDYLYLTAPNKSSSKAFFKAMGLCWYNGDQSYTIESWIGSNLGKTTYKNFDGIIFNYKVVGDNAILEIYTIEYQAVMLLGQ